MNSNNNRAVMSKPGPKRRKECEKLSSKYFIRLVNKLAFEEDESSSDTAATPPLTKTADTVAPLPPTTNGSSSEQEGEVDISTEIKKIKHFMFHIMCKVDAIAIKLKTWHPEQEKSALPVLPINTFEGFLDLEALLHADATVEKELLSVLKYTGGSKEKYAIGRCFEKIITNYVAQFCSRTGKKQNYKISTLKVMNVMKQAVRHTFPNMTDETFERGCMYLLAAARSYPTKQGKGKK